MKLKLLCAVLAACLALAACGEAPAGENTATVPATAQEEPVGTAPDESAVQDAPSQETESTQEENTMKNIALDKVPDGYYGAATQQGKLENFTYDTKDYIGNGSAIQSSAIWKSHLCSRKHFDEDAHSCVIEPKYFPVPMVKGIFPQKASMQRITGKQDLENEVTV